MSPSTSHLRPSDNRPSDQAVFEFLLAYHGIEPTDLEVLRGGLSFAAFAYEVIDKEPAEVAPRADYLELLVTGAREHGLPEDYIAELEHYTF